MPPPKGRRKHDDAAHDSRCRHADLATSHKHLHGPASRASIVFSFAPAKKPISDHPATRTDATRPLYRQAPARTVASNPHAARAEGGHRASTQCTCQLPAIWRHRQLRAGQDCSRQYHLRVNVPPSGGHDTTRKPARLRPGPAASRRESEHESDRYEARARLRRSTPVFRALLPRRDTHLTRDGPLRGNPAELRRQIARRLPSIVWILREAARHDGVELAARAAGRAASAAGRPSGSRQ